MTVDPLFDERQKDTYGPDASGAQESIEQVGWRKNETLTAVREAGPNGLTAHDLGAKKGWNHGIASAPLSMLHKDGVITRLTKRRAGYGVYVTLDAVQGRPTAQHRSNNANRVIEEVIATGKPEVVERNGVNVEIRVIKPAEIGNAAHAAIEKTQVDDKRLEFVAEQISEAYGRGYAEGQERVVRLPRPSLTPEQDDLREGVRRYLAGLADQSVIRLKRTTALELLEMIKRLEG